jgi:hypothetical protein
MRWNEVALLAALVLYAAAALLLLAAAEPRRSVRLGELAAVQAALDEDGEALRLPASASAHVATGLVAPRAHRRPAPTGHPESEPARPSREPARPSRELHPRAAKGCHVIGIWHYFDYTHVFKGEEIEKGGLPHHGQGHEQGRAQRGAGVPVLRGVQGVPTRSIGPVDPFTCTGCGRSRCSPTTLTGRSCSS